VPDLTVLLDVPEEVAEARLTSTRDRFEDAGHEFHRRVLAGYGALATDPGWVVVDGTPGVDEVAVAVRAAVRDRLAL
jgi:dTMP kinase